MSVRYKEIGNKCYELMKGYGSLPIFKLKESIKYVGKKSLTFVLKDDGRFVKQNSHGVGVWKIKERC